MAVERMKTCVSVDELAKELGVTRRCLYKWRTKLEAAEPGEEAPHPRGQYITHSQKLSRMLLSSLLSQLSSHLLIRGIVR
jgi:transposase-like protein